MSSISRDLEKVKQLDKKVEAYQTSYSFPERRKLSRELYGHLNEILKRTKRKFPTDPDVHSLKELPAPSSSHESVITRAPKLIEGLITVLEKYTPTPSMRVSREGVFFKGQVFDALILVTQLVASAEKRIVIIDGYISEDVLNIVSSKDPAVEVMILTKKVEPAVKTAAVAFNSQYGKLSIRTSQAFHDRFVIIDDTDFYHFGASIKDLGKRGFMFSRIEEPSVIQGLKSMCNSEWATATVVV